MNEFWQKYKDADYFARRELLKTLPLFQSLIRHRKDFDDEMFEYDFYSRIQEYIDDILDDEVD